MANPIAVSDIRIYPIKGFDGVSVKSVKISNGGALDYDRRFALTDDKGKFVNGKHYPQIMVVRSHFDLERRTVTFRVGESGETFSFHEGEQIAEWMSDYLEVPLRWQENTDEGFPDDTEKNGPTLVSEASIRRVAEWFPNLNREEIIRRVRVNVILANAPQPFWEDTLHQAAGEFGFYLGEVFFRGAGPCARCPVPTRSPYTGEQNKTFAREFARLREQHFPGFLTREKFDHFYKFTINTRIGSNSRGYLLKLGDEWQEG